MSYKGITDEESLNALEIVRETTDVYMLRNRLLERGQDFGFLMEALNSGVERGLYLAEQRDKVLRQNEDVKCMCAIAMVQKGDSYRLWKDALERGVRTGLFSRRDRETAVIEGVQVKYMDLIEKHRRNPRHLESDVIAWLPSECVR